MQKATFLAPFPSSARASGSTAPAAPSDRSSLCRDIRRQQRSALRMNIRSETGSRSPARQASSSWMLPPLWNRCPRGCPEPPFTARCSAVPALAPSRPSRLAGPLASFTRRRVVASSSIHENTKDVALGTEVLSCHKQDEWPTSQSLHARRVPRDWGSHSVSQSIISSAFSFERLLCVSCILGVGATSQ